MKRAFNIVGYFASIFGIAATTLALIPAYFDAGGVLQWSAVAVGQSVGAIGAVVGLWGWQITGPARLARSNIEQRYHEYIDSLRARLVVFPFVLFSAAAISVGVSHTDPTLSALASVTTSMLALRSTWYFVGVGRAGLALWVDAAPRILSAIVALFLLGLDVVGVAGALVVQVLGLVISFVATFFVIRLTDGRDAESRLETKGPIAVLLENKSGVSASVASALSGNAPVILVGAISPLSIPLFALCNRVFNQVATGSAPVIDLLQGWVPAAASDRQLIQRSRRAFALVLFLGGIGVLISFAFGGQVLEKLASDSLEVPTATAGLLALTCMSYTLSQVVARAILPALQRLPAVLHGTTAGLISVLVLVPIGVLCAGVDGALTGLAVSFSLALTIMLVQVRA